MSRKRSHTEAQTNKALGFAPPAGQSPAVAYGQALRTRMSFLEGKMGVASARLLSAVEAGPEGVYLGSLLSMQSLKQTLPCRGDLNAAFLDPQRQRFVKSSDRIPLS